MVISCACGCEKKFEQRDDHNRVRRFVSGHNTIVHNPLKKEPIQQICKTCGIIYYRKPSLANRGKNTYCSNKCRNLDTKSWFGGERNHNWKGGFNGVQNIRWSPEYRVWRITIFQRDNFICQKCGCKHTRKNPIHAHHIEYFSVNKDKMFSVDNGITLCKQCHLKKHTNREK
jgi:endogenous inhibitor of DNA gyrase (YacG/DUF329 family)